MSTTTGTTPTSAVDHTEPTLRDLADLADVLGDPLQHSLVLLEMMRDDEVQHQGNVAAAVMALIEQADQRRERLMEHLDQLAKRTTAASQDQP